MQWLKDAMKGFNYDPPLLFKTCNLLFVVIGGFVKRYLFLDFVYNWTFLLGIWFSNFLMSECDTGAIAVGWFSWVVARWPVVEYIYEIVTLNNIDILGNIDL